ncbi:insulin-like peptide receptor isoform X2 [Mya arenaria]|uniref:insulin-like peptide receptor isoform X2 n=1 Tax=Mya arenaria TaxID=6604 RepID=UPI0022E32060|nr:insulin-like peptide receptor isoform X2 [Mya arenaria]
MFLKGSYIVGLYYLVSLLCHAPRAESEVVIVKEVQILSPGKGIDSFGWFQIKNHGNWTIVCDHEFTETLADLTCRQLGFPEGGTFMILTKSMQGRRIEPATNFNFDCIGNVPNLAACYVTTNGSCLNGIGSIGLMCHKPVTLYGVYNNEDKQFMVSIDNMTNVTMCYKEKMPEQIANIACKQFGHPRGGRFVQGDEVQRQQDMLPSLTFRCGAGEDRLEDCEVLSEDVCLTKHGTNLLCKEPVQIQEVRLKTRKETSYGVLEVKIRDSWYCICGEQTMFSKEDTNAICRQLGFSEGVFHFEMMEYCANQEVKLAPLVFGCSGNETQLESCSGLYLDGDRCLETMNMNQDDRRDMKYTTISCSKPVAIRDIRLVGSKAANYGVLQVKLDPSGPYYAVCDDMFDDSMAKVACRQLKYTDARFQPGSALGNNYEIVGLKMKSCRNGTNTNLNDCDMNKMWGCISRSYVTLFCSNEAIQEEPMQVQLRSSKNYGGLWVKKYGFWGPVCDLGWTDTEADAACQALQFEGGVSYFYSFNQSNLPIAVGRFNCSDPNVPFTECSHKGFGEDLGCQYPITTYSNRRAAGVLCFKNPDNDIKFRLSDRWYGTVEIKYDNQWGRVCNTNFNDIDASVLCHQLGYTDGRVSGRQTRPSSGFVHMDNINCTGNEASILECEHEGYWAPQGNTKICNDAAVICNTTICPSLDIRNKVEQLSILENCTVIEGNLTILLIDSASMKDYEKYSFPNLVEITEYLLLFRADGLKTLSGLFPNLAVVRGDQLLYGYAVVAFEMPDLEELGLPSLVSVPRGAVRLTHNPNLCYVKTIDWTKIVKSHEDNMFKQNKAPSECVDRCHDTCPKVPVNGKEEQFCWGYSENECQKMLTCPATCKSGVCTGNICCSSHCLGGCTGTEPSQCTTCKDVVKQDNDGFPMCTKKCSPGTYMYRKHRCLLDHECLNFQDYKTAQCTLGDNITKNCLKLVVYDDISMPGECATDCPHNFHVDPTNNQRCIKCPNNSCPKICRDGALVDTIAAAQQLRECNIIEGPLHINFLRGNHVGEELERSLAHIVEVTHYIKITHADAIVSLHFFRNLKKIGGKELHANKYVLYVYDNQNLMELFSKEVAENLTIGNRSLASLHFQYNHKLCYNKITSFADAIGFGTKLETGLEATNGDGVPCDIQKLDLGVLTTTPHICILNYSRLKMIDYRHLIGYQIFWKETDAQNISIYRNRDACSDDIWQTKEICTDSSKDSESSKDSCRGPDANGITYITALKPWTQYAIYIQAITITKAAQGAISDVIYCRTNAEVPSSPMNLQVQALHPGELKITWDPPSKPRGNVTHYQVYWTLRHINASTYELRDYCTYPLTPYNSRIGNDEEEEGESPDSESGSRNATDSLEGVCPCQCPETEEERKAEQREREMEIVFHDYLQNKVYVKRMEDVPKKCLDQASTTLGAQRKAKRSSRPRRSTDNHYSYEDNTGTPVIDEVDTTQELVPSPSQEPAVETDVMNAHMADVYQETFFIISGLGHFQDYKIEVIACQEREDDVGSINKAARRHDMKMKCSQEAIGSGRTNPEEKADGINSSSVAWLPVANQTNAVHITWDDPPKPNGLIVTYEIEYKKSNIQHVKPNTICITYKTYRDKGKHGHTLDRLEPGNYTFRIRATSLAGNGSWTSELVFLIKTPPDDDGNLYVVVIVVVLIVVGILAAAGITMWVLFKRKLTNAMRDTMFTSANPEYYPDVWVYQPDEWEVDRENVKLIKELGTGSFGMVYEGLVKLTDDEEPISVAVKTANAQSNDHDRYQFLQEASIMKAFQCHHVVRLIGVVSKEQPAYVLMELMPQGDLKNFLRLHRPDDPENDGRQPPSLKQILQMAGEIADGMAYLADKKYVHRDLAARNCMVGNDLTVKIGDFGMTRDIYETDYYRKGSRGLLPVRWMSPESLKDGVFTSMTDVWSYGVVLWEMATLAAQPYQGLANEQVLQYVGSGKIMEMPERCPHKLYDLMVKCWRYRPKQRPTFKEIIESLLPDLDPSFKDVSYFFSEENAKYEESKQGAALPNPNEERLQPSDIEDDEDEDHQRCPMNDYVDEAQLPMLGVGASNGHSVELQDIFSDTGTYPHYGGSHNRQHVGSAEVCDCTAPFRDVDEGAAAQSIDLYNRRSVCSSPNSAIGGSSDGSKDSSKSSSSSYAHMNGLSVANGHVPVSMRTTPC